MKKIVTILMTIFVLTSCTENSRVKTFGGTGTINLPAGQKLVTVTWKGENLWYITRPMRQDELPETYKFQEESSYGIVEGTYNIIESK